MTTEKNTTTTATDAPEAPESWYEANTGNHQGLIISEITGENIAVSYDRSDARLIAAAPDLFRQLKEARDFIDCLLSNTCSEATDLLTNSGEDVLHGIYNAIWKAEGK